MNNEYIDFFFKIFNFNKLLLLEIIGSFTGIYSVILSYKVNIKTYPLSIISSIIYIYISYIMNIYANMVINIFYLIINLYGWYNWKMSKYCYIKITNANKLDYVKSFLFSILIELIVLTVFYINQKFIKINFFLDIITSFLFFVAMYHMVMKKLENWIFWAIGNFISVILYFHNEMIITGIQYLIYTLLSIKGYFVWKSI